MSTASCQQIGESWWRIVKNLLGRIGVIDIKAFLCLYAFMRTTIDLPEDLFREAKTRAVQQGTTLKNLMIQFVLSGLSAQKTGAAPMARRMPPPVAIRRIPGQAPRPALSSRELHAILEAEDATRAPSSTGSIKA
jgi:hypothetical protein